MADRLLILHPPGYLPERLYICDVIFRELLGLDYRLQVHEHGDVQILLEDESPARRLTMPDALFQTGADKWLTTESLPQEPLEWCTLPDALAEAAKSSRQLPIVFGRRLDAAPLYAETEHGSDLGLDIFGTAFFMLTRYEESVVPDRDQHERFLAKFSCSLRNGFLERPIVNEYVEVMWVALQRLWPQLKRKPQQPQILLSHDVDWPFCFAYENGMVAVKSSIADVLKRKDPMLAARRLRSYRRSRNGAGNDNLCDTFDFIMNLSEKHGFQSAFYFITDNTTGIIDGNYSLSDQRIESLIRRISERQHEIGLHASYGTYNNASQTKREFDRLLAACEKQGIRQELWGGRQHYLRWANPVTWQNWEDAGLQYDSTLSFADHVGFRCGICHEYPIFNLNTRTMLQLRERPLIVMDGTLGASMGLSWKESYQKIIELNAMCQLFQGTFTLLWHNSSLISKQEQFWYTRVLDGLAGVETRAGQLQSLTAKERTS